MLKKEMVENREYTAAYEGLYDYGKIQMENNLKPLKEYYYANPLKFDLYDPHLMHKAKNVVEAKAEQNEKFAVSFEHDQVLKKVFKEVEAQKREIQKSKLDVNQVKASTFDRSLHKKERLKNERVKDRNMT